MTIAEEIDKLWDSRPKDHEGLEQLAGPDAAETLRHSVAVNSRVYSASKEINNPIRIAAVALTWGFSMGYVYAKGGWENCKKCQNTPPEVQ